jgi:arylsulfatase A-like enzyme
MKSKPNILIIMVDQLRYDCLGYAGNVPVSTPHIDRLASEGAWFTSAFNHIPVCGPARQSFLCGLRPETFGGLWNYSSGLKIGSLEPTAYSWARTLQAAGYRNGYMGKWDVHPEYSPLHYGYDEYLDSTKNYQDFIHEKYPDLQYTNGYFGEIDPLKLEDTQTHRTAEMAGDVLERLTQTGGSWHLRVNFSEPHLPSRPTQFYAQLYDPNALPPWGSFGDTLIGKPYIQTQQLRNWGIENYTWQEWAPIVARYLAVISQLDDAIGRLLRQLDESGQSENTLVIFTSDHGDMCGSHRMIDKHYVMYEDVVKIPLAIRYPGVIPAGLRIDEFVYNLLDLPPTLLELCDLVPPEDHRFHGESILPLLLGPKPATWRQETVATYNGQQFGLFTQRMIRTQEWKYVWNPTDTDELYHLKEDPHELHNVVHHPSNRLVLQELRTRLYTILLKDGDGMVRNEWMKRQLLEGSKN